LLQRLEFMSARNNQSSDVAHCNSVPSSSGQFETGKGGKCRIGVASDEFHMGAGQVRSSNRKLAANKEMKESRKGFL
jgi:hypothetical protein